VPIAESRPVGAATKILYGIGEIAITMKMALFGLFTLFFYNSVMGLPALWVGFATALGLVVDAGTDPYIGYRSDASASRYGRRHAFMLFGALTMGVSFWMIWIPPRSLPPMGLFLWLLASMALFRVTSAFFRIPYLSLGAELSDDYHERTVIVGVRSFFGILGSLLAAVLSFQLFFSSTGTGIDPKLSYEGYPRMGLAFAVAMTLAAFVGCFGTWAYRFLNRRPAGPRPTFGGFTSGSRLAFGNADFRRVWLSFSLFFVAVVLNGAVSVHFLTWTVRISDSTALGRLQGLFYLSALVGVGFWVWSARRAEKRTLYMLSTSITAALMGCSPLLFGEGKLFGVGDPRPLAVLYGLAGFFASALWVIPSSMVADIADEDQESTGLRREGLFFGILNFGEKVAAGLAVLIGGGLIDFFAGLVPGEPSQTPETISRVGLIYGVAPAVLLVLAVVALSGYGLDRRAVASIQSRLRDRGLAPGDALPPPPVERLTPDSRALAGAPPAASRRPG
jgi:GPH family glycoside/pentoside/hexuronide:cation symporter